MATDRSVRGGISLIELLITISIITLLIQMALPAVVASREAARRSACGNNLRQLSVGISLHVNTHNRYPSGGWGAFWVGDPDRGTGTEQPGAWAYNILEYIEEGDLRRKGLGLVGNERLDAISDVCQTPVSIFNCPSRRMPRAYPRSNSNKWMTVDGTQELPIDAAVRSDYAINVGDREQATVGSDDVPKSYAHAVDGSFQWYGNSKYTGICYGRSEVRPEQVVDGTSKTYLVGEKFIPISHYEDGEFKADNEGVYSGFNNDNGRTAKDRPEPDADSSDEETARSVHVNAFGSAHVSVWQIAFCDGSVHSLSFDIDSDVHRQQGNRQDLGSN